jgi:signal transduction histidine kinase
MSSVNPKKTTGSAAANPSVDTAEFQDHLHRLDRLANLGLVSASAAHEIKNGLVAISTYVEILLEKGEDREMAEVVRRELKRIDLLVTQMLRYASPKPAARTDVHLHQLLDHVLRLLEHQMSGRMITLKREYRALPDVVRGDESQLQQAFMNLILNGVEAISSNGELSIITEVAPDAAGGRRLKVHFRDTGVGIAAENLPRVFDTFFTTKKHGTGLGLAISRRVAEEHGGLIEVHSEAGRGSTFTFLLPVE